MLITNKCFPEEATASVYNALDCVYTRGVFDVIHPQLDADTQAIYTFELTQQRVALFIMLRGVKIDKIEKMKKGIELERKILPLKEQFNKLTQTNVNSPQQMHHLFYNNLKVKVIKNRKTQNPTLDDKALDKIITRGGFPSLLARYVSTIRKLEKTISTLKADTDRDGRMRESINVSGTETGRWSSSKPSYGGLGMSGQNITESLRSMFVADEKHTFIYVDLDQAESRVVGLLCADLGGAYLKACESGDIHTSVCQMTWAELDWTGDVVLDREKASTMMLNDQFSYRDIAKRLGHGTNYMGSPFGMSYELKVPFNIIKDFQQRYFSAYPEIAMWHNQVAAQLQQTRSMTTILGRKRHFFGRVWEKDTIKEAVAYEPQSVVGTITNLALVELQRIEFIQPLKNLHDGALLMVRDFDVDAAIPLVLEAFRVPLTRGRHAAIIPCELKTGWHWGSSGVNGLRPHTPQRRRVAGTSILELRL